MERAYPRGLMTDESPTTIGPWALHERIATGPRATVWRASRGDEVAVLKVARESRDRTWLLRETVLLRKLDHPHVVRVLDYAPGGEWVALEHVQGHTLTGWAAHKSIDAICKVVMQIASAVSHLHERGVVHADLKPRNVIVREGSNEAVLIDLGVAVLIEEDRHGFRGTPGFVAPELLRGGKVDGKVDLYGLGALWYAALCGRPPFVATDPKALGYLPLVSLPAPPSAYRTDIPGGIEHIVLSLLQRDPARRPASIAAVVSAMPKACGTAVRAPFVGMLAERDELRRAVIGALDGECRVVIVYGPPGSGRSALVNEVFATARRAGLLVAKPPSTIAPIQRSKDPLALRLDTEDDDQRALLDDIMAEHVPGLYLVRADFPLPDAPAFVVQITPPPLDLDEIALVLQHAKLPASQAAALYAKTGGFAGAVVARVAGGTDTLPAGSAQILAALAPGADVSVEHLASVLQLSPLELLDHCEILFAAGLVQSSQDGYALRRTSPQE